MSPALSSVPRESFRNFPETLSVTVGRHDEKLIVTTL